MRLFFYLFVFFFFGTKNSSAYVKSYFLEKYTIQKGLRPKPYNPEGIKLITSSIWPKSPYKDKSSRT